MLKHAAFNEQCHFTQRIILGMLNLLLFNKQCHFFTKYCITPLHSTVSMTSPHISHSSNHNRTMRADQIRVRMATPPDKAPSAHGSWVPTTPLAFLFSKQNKTQHKSEAHKQDEEGRRPTVRAPPTNQTKCSRERKHTTTHNYTLKRSLRPPNVVRRRLPFIYYYRDI